VEVTNNEKASNLQPCCRNYNLNNYIAKAQPYTLDFYSCNYHSVVM
jgi:hypothetical protein